MIKQQLDKFHILYKQNISLKDYTTLHIGGKADYIVFPKSVFEVQKCIEIFNKCYMPYTVLGRGSNVLALDEGYKGAIIILTDYFSRVERLNETCVKVESGMTLKQLCQFCLKHNLTGLEFACGIPGSIGGAIYMNAGAYGGEMKDIVESVTYLDEQNNIKILLKDDLMFGYRHSYFTEHQGIILEVIYQLDLGEQPVIHDKMNEFMERRYARQPMDAYSAGSTFKRPNGYYASALIKECGLQGLCIGDAEVSRKHAGFLINKGKATSHDFLQLINKVQERVYEQTGYMLEREVQILSHKEKTL
ncbi:UDP-N-acetylmuramate dehydrogenase [Candidatus Stoquefichus massiliensis]|uniref:UDP-N-acetylmuramate dehydrogenase n=1 Tax=Candidatus Stoquefichus massiliensis TaxID=1470350 RepID=UPI0004B6CFDE|nr:UDP-N-acetylmuramate dehydrogenase [Candidatus Stoquefichus massiliensis]